MNIPNNDDLFEAGLTAWCTLTMLIDQQPSEISSVKEFKEFYCLVMEKLLSEEVTE